MFDEIVAVSGVRSGVSRRQALKVSVFDDSTDEAMDENALESEAETISCVARSNDWRFIRDCMVRGDLVRRADGREYQVTKIAHDSAMGWIFKARRTK